MKINPNLSKKRNALNELARSLHVSILRPEHLVRMPPASSSGAQLSLMQRAGYLDKLGEGNLQPHLPAAIARAEELTAPQSFRQ